MKRKIRILSALALALILLVCVICIGASADEATYSGECGNGVYWSLNTADGELVITGNGWMSYGTTPPWAEYSSYIRTARIESGVTSIGPYAFKDCSNLTTVTLNDKVNSLGYGAFYGCIRLQTVNIPDTVTAIGGAASTKLELL